MKFPQLTLLLAAALVLAACRDSPDTAQARLVLTECRLPGVETLARCGFHEVWEDREAKSGRRIRIKVAVIPAKLRAKAPDPVVIFAGGPGQGAIPLARQVMPLFARLNDARDIVFIDQRGTGGSHPLACDQDGPVARQQLFEEAIPEKLVADCLKKLDANPKLYVTSIAMQDLDEIRIALGYPKLNLWGGSYGTRAALEFMRRYPAAVRTATLDGMAPATMKLPLSFAADGDAALERLLASCAKDTICSRAYPRLRETISSLRSELARRPLRVAITDPLTGDRETLTVTEKVFLGGLFRPLYVAELASLLPFGVTAAAAGDFNPLLAQNFEMAEDVVQNLAVGMHLSVICAEDLPRITPEDMQALSKSFFGRALVEDFVRACEAWPRGKVPADYYEPVKSDVPVLIFSGGIDPATPPRHGEDVAKSLPNAKHLVAPELGHGVSSHGCAPRLVEAFIRAGNTEKIDGRCLERIPRPLFLMPLGTRP